MGAWTFIEPNIEWVLQHTPIANTRAALRRPAAVGGDGHRARQQAQPGAEGAGGAGAGRLDGAFCERDERTGQRETMTIEIKVPALGESVTEATVGQWFKKPGEAVKADEPLVELETDKVTVEVPAPAAGVLADIKVAQGTTVAVGCVLGSINEGAGARRASRAAQGRRRKPTPAAAAPKPAPAAARRSRHAKGDMPPAPAARKMMEEKGLSPADVQGSGRRGQVLKEDVMAAAVRPAGRLRGVGPAEAVAYAPMTTTSVPSRSCARRPCPTMPRARSA